MNMSDILRTALRDDGLLRVIMQVLSRRRSMCIRILEGNAHLQNLQMFRSNFSTPTPTPNSLVKKQCFY